jgi:hypothetical protein
MPTNITFKITPDRILFPEFPSFEINVQVSGWVFTDYTWSCLPGYIAKNSGVVNCWSSMPDGDHCWFYLYEHEMSVFDSEGDNRCYGILHNIPNEFTIGSTASSTIHYGGVKVKEQLHGKSEAVLYSDWVITNAY